MKKIALFSVIALSALMVGCSSTETRSDNANMEECNMTKEKMAKACPTEAKKKMDCDDKKMDCDDKEMDCDDKEMDCDKMADKKAMDCKTGEKSEG